MATSPFNNNDPSRVARVAGLVLAGFAAVWHAVLMTAATNDNFLHLTLAKQWLSGDWPVRDFFDQGSILQYAISAAAQAIGGDRLISEAVVVAVAWAISTYLVFHLVRRLTGLSSVAMLAALLLIMASARGYSYPKGIVYAVAAMLWWRYVLAPTTAGIVLLGAWAAVGFYWRADHGVYAGIGAALACFGAHGLRRLSISRCALAGVTMLALVAPYLWYVHAIMGLPAYIQTGVAAARTEHTTQGPHEWPVLRFGTKAVTVEDAERYAPVIGIRWTPESSPEERRQVLVRYGLALLDRGDDEVDRVRLSSRSIIDLRRILNEPAVADTAGVDRASSTLLSSSWPSSRQWKFNHAWLRVQMLPGLDSRARASEIAVALFYLLPIATIVAAPWLARYLSRVGSASQLVSFGAFVLLVDVAMLRLPFPARLADAVVLSAILFGCWVAALWLSPAASGWPARSLYRLGAVALTVSMILSVSTAAEFGERSGGLVGQGRSLSRARDTWIGAYEELVSSPPLAHFVDRRARLSLRLAAYVRDCVPASERLLVLWFEPEIYYFSDRLMAQRHLVFPPMWATVSHEQRMTLEKVARFTPPIALARRSALDGYAGATYPGVVDYLHREYQLGGTVADEGEEYLIYARRDRPVLRAFGSDRWPCFERNPSIWARVGLSRD